MKKDNILFTENWSIQELTCEEKPERLGILEPDKFDVFLDGFVQVILIVIFTREVLEEEEQTFDSVVVGSSQTLGSGKERT